VPKSHCLYVTVLSAFLAISPTSAEDLSDCPQLLYYADNQLANEWQAATLRTARAEDSIAIMKQARHELLDVGLMESYARTRGPELVHAIHAVSNALFNAISMGTGGTGKKLMETAEKFAERVFRHEAEIAQFFKAKGAVGDLFDYQVEVAAGKVLLGEVPFVGGAVNLFWDFARDIENQKYIRASGEELRAVTAGYLDRIDEKLAQYHQQLLESSESIAARDAIGGAIEQRCGWLREESARRRPVNPGPAPHIDGITPPAKTSSNAQSESIENGWYVYKYEIKVLDPRSSNYGVVRPYDLGFMDIAQCQKSRQMKLDDLAWVSSLSQAEIDARWERQEKKHTFSTLTECTLTALD